MGRAVRLVVLAALVATAALAPAAHASVVPPEQDPFYRYDGSRPLASIAPGRILKSRVVRYHVIGLELPIRVVQLLYRSTGQLGQPTVNVTSVLRPPLRVGVAKVISYQSFYDSLDRDDEPSYAIAGGVTFGGLLPTTESVLIVPALLRGYTVVVPDTEGQNADFGAGPEYGLNTLDSLRAAFRSHAAGIRARSRIGLIGYSGGAIATEWAAELAPRYAPAVNRRIIGAAFGGVLVDPAHNLHYVDGSSVWAGVMPMAIIGISRAFNVDLTPYLSDFGVQLGDRLQHASIEQVLSAYPGLTWTQLAKPQYPTPESVPVYVKVANELIMGSRGTPTAPLFIGQGAGGELEGTSADKPGIGQGDGVMVTGDVRTLAREYCERGVTVQYTQYDNLAHTSAAFAWLPEAGNWLQGRFAGRPAPQNCDQIPPGNPLDPIGPAAVITRHRR
jgi:hypothetical protein